MRKSKISKRFGVSRSTVQYMAQQYTDGVLSHSMHIGKVMVESKSSVVSRRAFLSENYLI